ncbi:jg14919 [Pararge aegeria aegeria]|uniref:Jg14919 protein n=1 Tax=Pararge aegeria aegeria TaxID=348720 RepID=A0A8S4QHE2_9NEOP|nr:jg14919 [Pararge aegeria aegeria]
MSSTWGRNPSRAISTAGARILAQPPAPEHTRDPKPVTDRRRQSNPSLAHVCTEFHCKSHNTRGVTGRAHRLWEPVAVYRALRSNRARAAGV